MTEAEKIMKQCQVGTRTYEEANNLHAACYGIIGKLLTQPEQEPVAYINVETRRLEWAKLTSWETPTTVNLPKIPLYAHPPQRTFVGLTDKEQRDIAYSDINFWDWGELMDATEAKLKEKNCAG